MVNGQRLRSIACYGMATMSGPCAAEIASSQPNEKAWHPREETLALQRSASWQPEASKPASPVYKGEYTLWGKVECFSGHGYIRISPEDLAPQPRQKP